MGKSERQKLACVSTDHEYGNLLFDEAGRYTPSVLAVQIGIHDRRRKAALLRCLHCILERHDRPDHLESGLRQRGLDIETYCKFIFDD